MNPGIPDRSHMLERDHKNGKNGGENKLGGKLLGELPQIQGPEGKLEKGLPGKLEIGPGNLNADQIKGIKAGLPNGKDNSRDQQRVLDRHYRETASLYNRPALIESKKTNAELIGQPGTERHPETGTGLGHQRYAEREAAAAVLESRGKATLPELRAAFHSSDPEIRHRAEGLVNKIESREALVSGKGLIKADEDLQSEKGKDLPADWSQRADNFISQAEKIDKSTLSRVAERLGIEDNQLLDGNSLELSDVRRLNEIAKNPRLECARSLLSCTGTDSKQLTQRMNKSAELLAEALEKRETKPNDSSLINLASQAKAIENPRFLSAYRDALAASDPKYKDIDNMAALAIFREAAALRNSINQGEVGIIK